MSPRTIQSEDALELMADLRETEVPIIPDDLLFTIFNELSTEERAPLGTSCKRFRVVDFELGRKSFEKISAKWNDIFHSVNGIAKNTNYSQQGRNSSFIPETIHNLRLFRKATTKLMKIKITSVSYPAKIQWNFCDKFKTIPYTILRGSIACAYPILENFHKNLIKDRNIEQASMYLKLFSSFSYYNPDIASEVDRTRAFLMQLPKVDNFKLVWTTKSSVSFEITQKRTIRRHLATVIDDPTLIHLVSNSNHTSLSRIHCTGHGLLSIF
ncbi:hypothetical protein PRIPAC_91858 [Pristionchus pacificus]|uniref:Uncharacterized protein n=1 Tax=Pristionchus pacificus TaxID=54126 RepID=A0A2A6BR64_PRIPA|nr:hypothetical protein PRIPAC_91858 [Pristionchus pacificus]|eukprot:PDM68283.1 hypothetical protein PRIPAC_46327 [Pristionchus pacificus]